MFTFLIIVFNLIWIIVFLPFAVVSLLSGKLRHPFFHRFGIHRRIRRWKKENAAAEVVTVHCASYGEFEHIRLFLRELKKNIPGLKIVILFFSPSGYRNIQAVDLIDLKIYTPFENVISNIRVFGALRPRFHIIAKHDVWPNEIFTLKKAGIPVFMMNGSLAERSSRIRHFRFLQKMIYGHFEKIFAVSESDRERFIKYLQLDRNKIEAIGDTKNDQALMRRQRAEDNAKVRLLKRSVTLPVFVAGSIWPEDWEAMKAAVAEQLNQHSCHVILVPHELHGDFLQNLESDCAVFNPVRYSEEFDNLNTLPRVLIVDKIGVLAELYALGNISFVGGSFKAKIHNVLEPAVYGIPVITGPKIENSTDALEMEGQGLIKVESGNAFAAAFNRLLNDETYRREEGKKAEAYVSSRLGTSEKLVRRLIKFMK